ncbi:transposable element Tcb1 transposase [Trichonephila clavipes]|nr:transposable element Tcb1 transposase [Trichonephila clavipes]
MAEGHLGSRQPLHVLLLMPTYRSLRLEWCHARGNSTAAEWNQVIFSEESRFNLISDENRMREWRPRRERLNSASALQRHTSSKPGVMPHVLPLVQRLPGAIFQTDNARPYTERVSQDCLCTLTCPITKCVSNRAYLGSFGTVTWASHEFERTRDKAEALPEPGESGNLNKEVVDLARQINSEGDRDDVQELLDSHNQKLTINS